MKLANSTIQELFNEDAKLGRTINAYTSNIYFDKNKKWVVKELKNTWNYPDAMAAGHDWTDCLKREAEVLKLLNLKKYDWAPKLIYFNEESLVTEYVGESINSTNIPLNYKQQANEILLDLKDNGIKHNDIKSEEILVKDGRLYLCDFGWASINDDMSCGINISKRPKPLAGPNRDILHKDEDMIKILDEIQEKKLLSEKHLVIDWVNYFSREEIEEHLKLSGLELIKALPMDELIDKPYVLSKFYKTMVDDDRGATPFTVYIINDPTPVYEPRETSGHARRLVNINLFDLKHTLRTSQLTGERSRANGHLRIHATDNIQEAKDNLRALNLFDEFYKSRKFRNMREVFDSLNSIKKLRYVIMRNFEGMPDNVTIDEHLDVDVLVDNYYLIKTILDGDSVAEPRFEDGHYRILNSVIIDNKRVLFDFRFTGDNYYDVRLEKRMIANRVKYKNFYIPDQETHLYALIYHALIHKQNISNTYKEIFIKNEIEDINRDGLMILLEEYMDRNDFRFIQPKDKSVGFFKK